MPFASHIIIRAFGSVISLSELLDQVRAGIRNGTLQFKGQGGVLAAFTPYLPTRAKYTQQPARPFSTTGVHLFKATRTTGPLAVW